LKDEKLSEVRKSDITPNDA